ncbi:MAG: hypothetical protein K2X74_20215, partial [Acetobacteraceae bacterium]|nr:hypothetical protein [Acetobacteraceae bacterium]
VGNAGELPGLLPALDRAVALAGRAQSDPALARQAASALYHLTSAAAMAWEAARIGDPDRALLARLALRHRVLPYDPLEPLAEEPVPDSLLPDPAVLAA